MGWLSALSAWAAPDPHRSAPSSKQLQKERGSRAGASVKGKWELIWQSTDLDQVAELLSRDSFFSGARFRHHNPSFKIKRPCKTCH